MSETEFTIVLLTRNRLAHLRRAVESVEGQLEPGDVIVVVDTGSTDGTRDWLESAPVQALLVDAPNVDFAAARNAGVQAAATPYLAFLDDDCVAPAGWLRRYRTLLTDHVACGGPVLPAREYAYPRWWSGDLMWCTGMSPPGAWWGADDVYPATANLAVRREVAAAHPFGETPHVLGGQGIYRGGREDAQWWLEARREGLRLAWCAENAVLHDVPAERFRWEAVRTRALHDGEAAWLRRPEPETAQTAAHEAARLALRRHFMPWRVWTSPANARADLVWEIRQRSLARAARMSGAAIPSESAARKHQVTAAVKQAAGDAVVAFVRRTRGRFQLPPVPRRVAVVAPTFLGDTILLRAPLAALARAYSDAEVLVVASYLEVLSGLPHNVRILHAANPAAESALRQSDWDSVLIPYYHHGDARLYRSHLAQRARVFDREAGFARRTDPLLAATMLTKTPGLHEVQNLMRLFAAWPLEHPPVPVPAPLPVPEVSAARRGDPVLADGSPFAIVQVDAAGAGKVWPVDRWIGLASGFRDKTGLRIAFVALEIPAGWNEATKALDPRGCQTAFGWSVSDLTGLIARASIVIGPCSGPKHLAMALGVPTFCLYSITHPRQWGPWHDHALHGHIIAPAHGLTLREHEGLPENYLMEQITAAEAVSRLLAHWASLPR